MTERVIDVVPGLVVGHKADGRCVYDRAAKRELVRRCLKPGVSVAAIALAHGINANLLRMWNTRSQDRVIEETPTAAVLLPVKTQPAPSAPSHPEGEIERVLPMGTLRLRGRVCTQLLQSVIDCLSRRS